MRRRPLLAMPTLATLLVAAPWARAQTGLSDADRAGIARAEVWLNALRSLKARFLQIAQTGPTPGASAEGTAWIVRPDRMRFEYDPPEPLLLVASHGQFFYFDRELRQPTVLPLSSTPLGLLLRDNMRLAGDVTVSGVERAAGWLRVSLHRTGQAAEGRLTLVFGTEPFELRQWHVVDAQARETRVTLSQAEYGLRFDRLLFEFNDPVFRERLGIN